MLYPVNLLQLTHIWNLVLILAGKSDDKIKILRDTAPEKRMLIIVIVSPIQMYQG